MNSADELVTKIEQLGGWILFVAPDRENNIGAYECQSCGLSGIEEHIARRLM